MQDAIAEETTGDETRPRFRIGINTGTALIGNVGSAEMRSFNVVGDAIDIAARLETLTEAGEVVIGEDTYRTISERVSVTELGPIELKGKSEPTIAYRLEGISAPARG